MCQAICLFLSLFVQLTLASGDHYPEVKIVTTLGEITIELFPGKAPRTVDNFLKYVDAGYYNGGSFYRTVTPDNQPDNKIKIEVIQADVHPWYQEMLFPPIPLERTNKTDLKHRDGTISMARDNPDSAQSSFFICIGDQPELDFGGKRNPDGQGFAAFGQVVEGMEIVKKIQQFNAAGQAIMPPIQILKITRISK